jgi:acyl-CoA thioester hydrolase
MSKIKIDCPEKFPFTTTIQVRITDINYGGHAGNDSFLALIHEARMQFLKQKGYTELDCGGVGMIMRDMGIEFKEELFFGDIVIAHVIATDFSKLSFEFYYKLEKEVNGVLKTVALAKTGMIGYDYLQKKISPLPDYVVVNLQSGSPT